MKHPMQFQETDKRGILRFVENPLVSWMVDQLPGQLNKLTIEYHSYPDKYSQDDYDQIMQLIGYSVSGIPYQDRSKYEITDNNIKPEEAYENQYKELIEKLKPLKELLEEL